MRRTRWYLIAAILGLALAQPARAAGQPKMRGDPKTTYDQSENKAHSGGGDGSDTASDTEAVSTTNQTDTEGHWLVRQVRASSSGQWTLYDTGEVKRAGGL